MASKTKAILKTAGIVLAGAAIYGYLPLVSFALMPQFTGWIHVGLATIHPWLGEALLGASCLAGVIAGVKRTWSRYFSDRKLEKKIEQIVAQKMAHRQKEEENLTQQKQKENTQELQSSNKESQNEVPQQNSTQSALVSEKNNPIKHSDLKLKQKIFGIFRGRNQQHRDAA